MIPLLLTGLALYKQTADLLSDDDGRPAKARNTKSPRSRDDDDDGGHPLLIAGGVAVAAGLLTRAVVRKKRYYDLSGKVVVLTGGSRGLGLAVARLLVDKGAKLALCARSEGELREAQDELRDRGGDVFAGVCDVTKPGQVRTFLGQVKAQMGNVDVLINNAGQITVGPASSMTRGDFDKSMATHFDGPLTFILELLPTMRKRGSGRVCNVASFAGRVPVPHMVPYVAGKFALVGLGEALRTECAADGVYVTTVCPGTVRTGSTVAATFKGHAQDEFEWFANGAYAPVGSISADRMAAKIVDAIEHGDAEVIAPLIAKVQTMLQGVAPGVGTELLTLLDRFLLPPDKKGDTSGTKGRKLGTEPLPAYTAEMQEEMAESYNETT